ncbi:acetate/propionate family kinase [Martelella alba]|uniref:Acetate kinase n=1 Tax=Martelella alba TaxID=2590451 RepID=A0ABY2SPU8_9HYPH|nr:acetate kinase [Martelella alba]TKI08059.1 acetate kinase [Martelella alba]
MTQLILAVNAGSSSLKFELFAMPEETTLAKGVFERLGSGCARFTLQNGERQVQQDLSIATHRQAADVLLDTLLEQGILPSPAAVAGVGHRIAHGGEFFQDSALIDAQALAAIDQLGLLAPLHNPVNALGVRAFQQRLPDAVAVGVFDTAFHQTIREAGYIYPLPYHYYRQYGIRRYGFHGTSHKYVAQTCAGLMGRDWRELRIISCHLGNGASLCAIDHGRSAATSMGFTPLAGLMMGTRCGDIDPSILPFIADREKKSAQQLLEIMNNRSGLLGISGISNDCRDIVSAIAAGNSRAALALEMFTDRIRTGIGGYAAQMGGVDAVIFTAGIGEHSVEVRRQVCRNLAFLGIRLDEDKNRRHDVFIHQDGAPVVLAVIPTHEELMIARDVMRVGLGQMQEVRHVG